MLKCMQRDSANGPKEARYRLSCNGERSSQARSCNLHKAGECFQVNGFQPHFMGTPDPPSGDQAPSASAPLARWGLPIGGAFCPVLEAVEKYTNDNKRR